MQGDNRHNSLDSRYWGFVPEDHIVYLDGKANKEPDNVQYTYYVKLKQRFDDDLMKELGITMEDLTSLNTLGYMPLTNHAVNELKKRTDLVESITLNRDSNELDIYPLNGNMHWTRDNYGPIWIPKKGASIDLTLTARYSSTTKRPRSTPSRWTTTGCRVTIATTRSTHATGALYLKTISWASPSLSGGAAILTDEASQASVGTDCSDLSIISNKSEKVRR